MIVMDDPCLSLVQASGGLTSGDAGSTTPGVDLVTTAGEAATAMGSLRTGNGSAIVCSTGDPGSGKPSAEESSLNALMYIVVVLLFYAFSIVVLMIKYIRRENKEAYLRQYFHEYVARDRFQSPQTRNQLRMKHIIRQKDLQHQLARDTSDEHRKTQDSSDASNAAAVTEQTHRQQFPLAHETPV